MVDLVARVLHHRHAAGHVAARQHRLSDRGDALRQLTEAARVAGLGALLLAQADRQHLDQTALVAAAERTVRLDPAQDQRGVGLRRELVAERRQTGLRLAQRHHLHGGSDRRLHGGLGDPHLGQQLGLAGGGGPAVAAHRRHHERLPTEPPHGRRQQPHQLRQVRQAAAAHRQRHPLSRPHHVAKAARGQRVFHRRRQVADRGRGEVLPHRHHFRQRHLPQDPVYGSTIRAWQRSAPRYSSCAPWRRRRASSRGTHTRGSSP